MLGQGYVSTRTLKTHSPLKLWFSIVLMYAGTQCIVQYCRCKCVKSCNGYSAYVLTFSTAGLPSPPPPPSLPQCCLSSWGYTVCTHAVGLVASNSHLLKIFKCLLILKWSHSKSMCWGKSRCPNLDVLIRVVAHTPFWV